MTQMLESSLLLAQDARVRRGLVAGLPEDGTVCVTVAGRPAPLACLVLQNGAGTPVLAEGDEVLVWLDDMPGNSSGVILGCIAPYAGTTGVVPAGQFAQRPRTVIIEAQEEIILRNGHARLRLGARGDIEFVGESFSCRARRLLRLLAPLIKLN
jgi:hypothetical protein